MLTRSLFSYLCPAGEDGKLSVLVFHKVPKEVDLLVPNEVDLDHFEQILAFVARHFQILPLSEAASLLSASRLPARAAAITFDDGYEDWHSGVTDLLRQYDAPATFFIVTEQLLGIPLWHERIVAAVRALPDTPVRLPDEAGAFTDLTNASERRKLVIFLQERLKHRPLAERLEVISILEAAAERRLDVAPPYSAARVLELHSQGFEIGAHTVRHPTLTKCSEREARQEIGASREELEALIRAPVQLFAYPNGRPGTDFSPDHVRIVRECGYRTAVTTTGGAATAATSPFLLPRFTPWGKKHWRLGLQLTRNIACEAPASQ